MPLVKTLEPMSMTACDYGKFNVHQTICDVTSSNFLGRLVQCEQKVGQGEVGWYIHNSMAVCGYGCKNPSVGSLHK